MRSFSKTWYGFTLSSSLNFGYTSILIYSQFDSSRYKIHIWISGRKQKTNKPTRAATVYQKAIAVPFNKLTKHKTICHRQIFEWPMQKHPKDPMRKKTFSRDSFFFCFATVLLYYECNLAEITWICNFPRREEVCMYCIDSLISKISPNTTNQFKYNISPYPIFLLWTTQTLQNIKKKRQEQHHWNEQKNEYIIIFLLLLQSSGAFIPIASEIICLSMMIVVGFLKCNSFVLWCGVVNRCDFKSWFSPWCKLVYLYHAMAWFGRQSAMEHEQRRSRI